MGFLGDDKVRADPVMFNVSLSGAAQHIYTQYPRSINPAKQHGTLLVVGMEEGVQKGSDKSSH